MTSAQEPVRVPVQADQVYEWHTAAPYGYRQYAEPYSQVAEWLDEARPVS